ncbi:MAG: mechanosensitive ion channel protein MscS [Bacteroidetes bacterium GWA2_30_7]|nr:MAG: mechanosensitive ion channel protein MscS [Bacteroidetes bacterium GWA2_30_7]
MAFIFKDWLISSGFASEYVNLLNMLTLTICLILTSIILNYLAKTIIVSIISRFIKKSTNKLDDILLEKKVFHRLSHFVPALIIYYFSDVVFYDYHQFILPVHKFTYIYMIIAGAIVINAFLKALNEIYNTLTISKNHPIKSYIQVVQIIIYLFVSILILSLLLGKSPVYLITGMGAITAVLLLVFKDPLLGLVGGIQLSSNDMIRIGDWISMPSKNADGIVIEISLITVKVQNFDKSITTIPTYSLISEAFSNWRGMEESEGRRIKRSLNIDMKSIKFLDEQLTQKLSKIKLLSTYLQNKQIEIEKYNKENDIDYSISVNGIKLTNIGTLRVYLNEYIKSNPDIHPDMTLLVRQLQSTDKGIPLEVYAFSKIKSWEEYEDLQADIFDHIMAIIPEFELNVFQNPSGDDFKKLIS